MMKMKNLQLKDNKFLLFFLTAETNSISNKKVKIRN